MTANRIWREPLVHFFVIGAVIFLFYGITREGESEAPNRIVVTNGQVAKLTANFERTWMRPPTPAELTGLIENDVRDEVFYREALAMGLDQNDPLVRRRMRMKLEFILEDLTTDDASDDALTAVLQDNPDKYRLPARVSFEQIFLDPKRRDDIATDAQALLARLNDGTPPASLGDATLLPNALQLATHNEIARSFGERFADELVKSQAAGWTGPVYSAYGAHLLKVSARHDARMPPLNEVRERVKHDYLTQQRAQQKQRAYERLRDGYEVTIEPADVMQAARGNAVATAQASDTNAPAK